MFSTTAWDGDLATKSCFYRLELAVNAVLCFSRLANRGAWRKASFQYPDFQNLCCNKMAPIEHITAFEDLWQRASSERSNILHHPFVLSILTGTLPYSCLTNCLRDEAYLLTAVSEVFNNQPVISTSLIKLSSYVQNLRTCSRNEETQKQLVDDASDAMSQVSVSAKKFKAFLLEQALWNDSFNVVVSSLVTLQIRRELENTIANFIPLSGKGPSALQLWISSYANSEMQISTTLLAKEVAAKLSQNTVTVDGVTQLQHVIKATLVHQLHVLDSASAGNLLPMVGKHPISNPWYPHRLVFTTDYDVTCTEKDTCEILVALAEASLKRNSLELIRDETLYRERFIKRDLMAMYWWLLEIHDQRLKECLTEPVQNTSMDIISVQHEESELVPSVNTAYVDKSLRDVDPLLYIMQPGMDPSLEPLVNLAQELLKSAVPSKGKLKRDQRRLAYNDSGLREVLKLLGGLEKKVNQEIMASGVLRGITRKEIRGAARKFPLRRGCAQVLFRLVAGGTPVHLISANWSRDLIAGGLPSLPEEKLYIHSNDLHYDPEGVSDGTFPGVLQDAFDKETILQALRLVYTSFNSDSFSNPCYNLHSQNSPFFPPNEITNDKLDYEPDTQSSARNDDDDFESKMAVFLGDSPNDLLALLDADLGIVFGQNKALRFLISTHNVKLLPLVVASAQISLSCPEKDPVSFRNSGFLFEAASWADVEACLFGHCDIGDARLPISNNQILHSHI